MRLTAQVCRDRLRGERRAVLGTVTPAGVPHLVPITFAVEGDEIVSAVDQKPKRTQALTRLDNVRAHPRVAVLADRYDEDWGQLWWVRADGRGEVIEEGPGRDAAIELLVARYDQYRQDRPRGPVIRVRVDRWSGWAAR